MNSALFTTNIKRVLTSGLHIRSDFEPPNLIAEMKAEIAAIKAGGVESMTDMPVGISKKKKAIAEYMRLNPTVTNKALIARESGASRWTVQKYYDNIRQMMTAD